MRTIPVTKANLSVLVRQIEAGAEEVVITKKGKVAAILVSPKDHGYWESLKETAEILADPEMMRQIRASQRKGRKARIYTSKELDELCGIRRA